MKRFEGVLGFQVRSMLEGIEHDLAERKREITAEAEQRAIDLLRAARRQCRQRGQRAVAEERVLMAAALAKTDAALASHRRRRQQAIDADRLERGLDWLRRALSARWEDPAHRRAWIATALETAAEVLPSDGWTVEYPGDLDESVLTEMVARTTDSATLSRSGSIDAGLCIRRGAACLDMTVDGLLARQSSLSGDLLAEIYALDSENTEHDDG